MDIAYQIRLKERELEQEKTRLKEYETMNSRIDSAVDHLNKASETNLANAFSSLKKHYNYDGNSRDDGKIDKIKSEINKIIKELKEILTKSNQDVTNTRQKINKLEREIVELKREL